MLSTRTSGTCCAAKAKGTGGVCMAMFVLDGLIFVCVSFSCLSSVHHGMVAQTPNEALGVTAISSARCHRRNRWWFCRPDKERTQRRRAGYTCVCLCNVCQMCMRDCACQYRNTLDYNKLTSTPAFFYPFFPSRGPAPTPWQANFLSKAGYRVPCPKEFRSILVISLA